MTHEEDRSPVSSASQEAFLLLEEQQLEAVAGGKFGWGCCFGKSPTTEGSSQQTPQLAQSQIMRAQNSLALRPGNLENVADRTSIPIHEYEEYKIRRQQQPNTVAGFKEPPSHLQ